MTQGSENDLKDIRYYTNTSRVETAEDNEPLEDLNDNLLTIDNKAILAKTLADDATAQLIQHIGGSGSTEHPSTTAALSGFISTADKLKLDGIQAEAKINILAPVDALELVGGGTTTLHSHITATDTTDGLLSAANKSKLNGIATGANVNFPNLADADALARDPGGDANSLHTHTIATFFETFRETGAPIGGVTYHDEVNHSSIPGVPPIFSGFPNKIPYLLGPTQVGNGVTVWVSTYFTYTTLEVVTAGTAMIRKDSGVWNNSKTFEISNVQIIGLDGIVTYEINSGGDNTPSMTAWQGGYGQ